MMKNFFCPDAIFAICYCFSDLTENWYWQETEYSELNGDDDFFVLVAIFKIVAIFTDFNYGPTTYVDRPYSFTLVCPSVTLWLSSWLRSISWVLYVVG